MIYFVEAIGSDAIKIGYARANVDGSVRGRVSTMQSNCPLPLKLLAAIEGGYADERHFHSMFCEDWIRGDWFRASPLLRQFTEQFPTPELGPRAGDPRYNRRPRPLADDMTLPVLPFGERQGLARCNGEAHTFARQT